jgi:23S rRNA pseudouridine1911/1915/1917 synthase
MKPVCDQGVESITRLMVSEPARRLDLFLASTCPQLTRSGAQRLIAQRRVTVNGAPAQSRDRLAPGDEVEIRWPDEAVDSPQAEPVALSILYEDEHILVVDKPAGMVVHAGAGHLSGTLVNALIAHRPSIAAVGPDSQRAGIVHRLDRDTSGVMVVAASEEALRGLQRQFRRRETRKEYLALVYGQIAPCQAAIEAPLGRDPLQRKRMAVQPDGRHARTEYHVEERLSGASLLTVQLLTGRTHQIRVHLASIGYPVVGDRVYGPRRQAIVAPRQFLHARLLGLVHPITGQRLEFAAPLPADLQAVLTRLRSGGKS